MKRKSTPSAKNPSKVIEILENADQYRRGDKEPESIPALIQEPVETDENKTVEQLWKEGKIGTHKSDEFILGIEWLGTAKYKIYVDDITIIFRTYYLPDALDPQVIGGVRYSVVHNGRRCADFVTADDFTMLVARFPKKAVYYWVDMADPIEERFVYRSSEPDYLTRGVVEQSRAERQKAVDEAIKRRTESATSIPKSLKIEQDVQSEESEE